MRQVAPGKAANIAAIARVEAVDRSYISRMINLTTLAPDIQAAILHETLSDTVSLFGMASDTPLSWEEQRGRVENNALGGQLQFARHCRLTAFAGNHPGEFVNRQR